MLSLLTHALIYAIIQLSFRKGNNDMSKPNDLTGMKFGRWTAIELAPSNDGRVKWVCECECHTRREVFAANLTRGMSVSCGCYGQDSRSEKRMREAHKLIGNTYGRLTVVDILPPMPKKPMQAKCICRCNLNEIKECIVSIPSMINGHSTSCGCVALDLGKTKSGQFKTKHGGGGTHLYGVWRNMIARCHKEGARGYNRYGGKGIKVCDEWLYSFETFREWALAHGYREGLSIERKINTLGYCPENCTWIEFKNQNKNKSNVIYIEIDGKIKHMSDWCKITGVKVATASFRIKAGWDHAEAVTIPANAKHWNRWSKSYDYKEELSI